MSSLLRESLRGMLIWGSLFSCVVPSSAVWILAARHVRGGEVCMCSHYPGENYCPGPLYLGKELSILQTSVQRCVCDQGAWGLKGHWPSPCPVVKFPCKLRLLPSDLGSPTFPLWRRDNNRVTHRPLFYPTTLGCRLCELKTSLSFGQGLAVGRGEGSLSGRGRAVIITVA